MSALSFIKGSVRFSLTLILFCVGLGSSDLMGQANKAVFSPGTTIRVCSVAECPLLAAGSVDGEAVDRVSRTIYFAPALSNTVYAASLVKPDLYSLSAVISDGALQSQRLARDSQGNLFLTSGLNSTTVYEFPVQGSTYGAKIAIGSSPLNAGPVAVDSLSGTVFYVYRGLDGVEVVMQSTRNAAGTYGPPSALTTPLPSGVTLGGLAVDPSGNLYLTVPARNVIQRIAPVGGVYGNTPQTMLTSFATPVGIAVDTKGDLYLSRAGASDPSTNGIYEEALNNDGSYTLQTLFAAGESTYNFAPNGLDIDNAGSVYFGAAGAPLRRYNPPSISDFGNAAVGAAATPLDIRFQLLGTDQFGGGVQPERAFTSGIEGQDFSVDLTQSTCAGAFSNAGGALGTDAYCTVHVNFTPSAVGARHGAVRLYDAKGTVIGTAYVQGGGLAPLATLSPGVLSTLAGYSGFCSSTIGVCGDGGNEAAGQFASPGNLTFDGLGNIYVVDYDADRIRKISSAGVISTVAGTGAQCSSPTASCGDGGAATKATFNNPAAIAVDGAGNLYLSDTEDRRVRRVDGVTGLITTFAGNGQAQGGSVGSAATSVALSIPTGVAVDGNGTVYLSDLTTHAVYTVSPYDGILRAFAGSGVDGDAGYGGSALHANLHLPSTLAVDRAGNIYIGDEVERVSEVTVADGLIHTLAGTGVFGVSTDGGLATSAALAVPSGIAVDAGGNLYIAETSGNRIRKVSAASGVISTVAGTTGMCSANSANSVQTCGDGGPAISGTMGAPFGIAIDTAGNLIVSEVFSGRLRGISAVPAGISFAPTVVGKTSSDSPRTVVLTNAGNLPLAFTNPASVGSLNPAVSANFGYGMSSTCDRIGSNSTPYVVGPGADCTELFSFTPTLSGPLSGTGTTSDNSLLSNMQMVPLTGSGTGSYPASTLVLTASSTTTAGSPLNFLVTATDVNGHVVTTYTGPVQFSSTDLNATLPNEALLSGGLGSFSAILNTVGQQSITAFDVGNVDLQGTTEPISVSGMAPSIVFVIADHVFGDPDFILLATSPSPGPFTYTIVSGPASINGATVHLTGAGAVTINATQAASGEYGSGWKTASFTVSLGTAPISFSVPNHIFGDADFSVLASSFSSGLFTYIVRSGPATVNGSQVHLNAAGLVVLEADQAATTNYNSNSQTATFTVAPQSPNIAFVVSNHVFGDADFGVGASSPSAGAISYSVISGNVTIAGNLVHIVAAGTVTLLASQIANGSYAAASQSATFVIARATPVLAFAPVATHTVGDPDFLVNASSSSPGTILYQVVSGPATIIGNVVHLAGVAGTIVVEADQAESQNFSATSSRINIVVNTAQTPTISFVIPNHTYGDSAFPILAQSNSPGIFSYAIASGLASINGTTLTLTGAGNVTVSATQQASDHYASASKSATFAVSPANVTLVWATPLPVVYGAALSSVQLSAAAEGVGGNSLPGTFAYSPALGSIPVPPSVQLATTFTPTDAQDYTVTTATAILAVAPAPLVAVAFDNTRAYGLANPTFAGSLSGIVNGDTLVEAFTTSATISSPTGTYAILPEVSGQNVNRYAPREQVGILTIVKAPTKVLLILSSSSAAIGDPVTFTGNVLSMTSGSPSGSIQILDGGILISPSLPISNGQVTYTTNFKTSGTHTITASYSGDGNFIAGVGAGTVLITASQDFTMQVVGPTPGSVQVGGSVPFSLQLAPNGAVFLKPITLSFQADLPFYARGSFDNSLIASGTGLTNVIFTITTNKHFSLLSPNGSSQTLIYALLAPVCLLLLGRLKDVKPVSLFLVFVSSVCILSATGCGTGYAAYDIPVVVVAQGAGFTHTVNVIAHILQTPQ